MVFKFWMTILIAMVKHIIDIEWKKIRTVSYSALVIDNLNFEY